MISFHIRVTRIVPGLFHVKVLASEFSCGTLTMNTEGLAAFKEVIVASQHIDTAPVVTWEET